MSALDEHYFDDLAEGFDLDVLTEGYDLDELGGSDEYYLGDLEADYDELAIDDAGPGLGEVLAEALSDRDVLEADSTVEVVGSIDDGTDVVDAVTTSRCDAVVWMLSSDGDSGVPEELLRRHPSLRIVAVEGAGERASLWLMQPHGAPLGQLSPERIVAELRGGS